MDFVNENASKSAFLRDNLRALRKRLNWSQEELAEKIGLNRGNIASYENGSAEPKICNLVKLSNVLGVAVFDLTHSSLQDEHAYLQAAQQHQNGRSVAVFPSIDEYAKKADDYQDVIKGLHCLFQMKMNAAPQASPEVKTLQDQFEQLHDVARRLLDCHCELIAYIKSKCPSHQA